MARKNTVHDEVTQRLRGPGAKPAKKGELEAALGTGELETVSGKLKSCALACGVPAADVEKAVESFADHVLTMFGEGADDVTHDDATCEAYFTALASALKAPPAEKVPDGPEARRKLKDAARRITNSGHGGGGSPPA